MDPGRIRHTVAFTLRHEPGSPEAERFLADGTRILTGIPGVEAFECLRQVSAKNPYRYGFSMEFADQAAYDAYDAHPDHQGFVQDRWVPEVTDFLEADFAV